MRMPSFVRTALLLAAMPLAAITPALAQPVVQTSAPCSAKSAGPAPAVVELYTSEGCSSCPPADRWLSQLKGRNDVIALAFHVSYWDRLGWPDRFASPALTQRQEALRDRHGARYVYTPQVVVDGRDTPGWQGWRAPASSTRAASPVSLQLARTPAGVEAVVQAASPGAAATPGAPVRLAAYWVVLEDGHSSAVKAGENAGETLKHDHVVRAYRPVPGWRNDGTAQRLVFDDRTASPAGTFARRVLLVVSDEQTGLPLQALALAC